MIKFTLNGQNRQVNVAPEMPLLWVLRDVFKLTGTQYACGTAHCPACTVRVDGEPVRSCVLRASAVAGKQVTTIEGLAPDGRMHPVQRAWLDLNVPHCGYCQSGQIMGVVSLLEKSPNPTDEEIDQLLSNLCHCVPHARIRRAIHAVAGQNGRLRTRSAASSAEIPKSRMARSGRAESATPRLGRAKAATARSARAKSARTGFRRAKSAAPRARRVKSATA